MLFSGKENVFMCLDVFQKIFRKIFFGVWKMLQGKDKPISTRTKPRLTLDARDLAAPENTSRSRRTNPSRPRRRSRDREAPRRFAGSRSARTRDRDRRFARSRRSWSREAARCFARSRSTARSWWVCPTRSWCVCPARRDRERQASIWVLSGVEMGLSFPCSIFQTPKNIFRKIFWNTTKHIKTFSFPEMLLREPNTALVTNSFKFHTQNKEKIQ